MNNIEIKTTMSSREIAELAGKRHSDVMEAIRAMEAAWTKLGQRNFPLTYYSDQWNRQQPQYELSKTECLYVATKFNDEARAKLIIRWEELEKKEQFQIPQSYSEALKLAATQAEQIERQQKLIESQKQKVEFVDRILDTDEKIDIGQAAKILGLPFGRNTMFVKLRELGVFFKNKNEPKQEYIDRKYFELKEKWIDRNEHDGFMVVKVLVTQKGLAFLSKLFNTDHKTKKLAKIA